MSGDKEQAALPKLKYVQYSHEKEPLYLTAIRKLIAEELSEPYSIYVYRYFLGQWGELCFLVGHGGFLVLMKMLIGE